MKSQDQIKSYRLQKKVGTGAFGTVWKASKNNQIYALKILNYDQIKKKHYDPYLQSEIKIMKQLTKHQNFVNLIDQFNYGKQSVNYKILVLEFCEEGNLEEYHHRYPNMQKKEIWDILMQIIEAISVLHKREIIHRDLKNQNILVTIKQKKPLVKIADFGISKKFIFDNDNAQNYFTNTYCGTVKYMAIQVIRNENYTFKADIWSIGVIFYSLLYNSFPFKDGLAAQADIEKQIKNGFVVNNKDATQAEKFFFRNVFCSSEKRLKFEQILSNPLIIQEVGERINNINQSFNKVFAQQFSSGIIRSNFQKKIQEAGRYQLSKVKYLIQLYQYIDNNYLIEMNDKDYLVQLLKSGAQLLIFKNLELIKSKTILGYDYFKMNCENQLKKDYPKEYEDKFEKETKKIFYQKHYGYFGIQEELKELQNQKDLKNNDFETVLKRLDPILQQLTNKKKQNIPIIINLMFVKILQKKLSTKFQERYGYYHIWKMNNSKKQVNNFQDMIEWTLKQDKQILKEFSRTLKKIIKSVE